MFFNPAIPSYRVQCAMSNRYNLSLDEPLCITRPRKQILQLRKCITKHKLPKLPNEIINIIFNMIQDVYFKGKVKEGTTQLMLRMPKHFFMYRYTNYDDFIDVFTDFQRACAFNLPFPLKLYNHKNNIEMSAVRSLGSVPILLPIRCKKFMTTMSKQFDDLNNELYIITVTGVSWSLKTKKLKLQYKITRSIVAVDVHRYLANKKF